MTKFYSKTTGGFYDSEIHKTMPEDAIELEDIHYETIIAMQSEGKAIVDNGYGLPMAVDRYTVDMTQYSDEQLWKQVRYKRDQLLKETDYTQLSDIQANMTDEQKDAWTSYRLILRSIPSMFDKPLEVVFPDKPTS